MGISLKDNIAYNLSETERQIQKALEVIQDMKALDISLMPPGMSTNVMHGTATILDTCTNIVANLQEAGATLHTMIQEAAKMTPEQLTKIDSKIVEYMSGREQYSLGPSAPGFTVEDIQ